MRLIDADKLIEEGWILERHGESNKLIGVKSIADVPTVEAIPVQVLTDAILDKTKVVHCKDCTHWGTGLAAETEKVKCCEFGKYMVGENGYCVYGELRSRCGVERSKDGVERRCNDGNVQ